MSNEFQAVDFLVPDLPANVVEELTSLLTFYKSLKTTLERILGSYDNKQKISDKELADLEEGASLSKKIGLLSTRVLELTKEHDKLRAKEAQLRETIRRQDGEFTNEVV
ncbi:hypothetical protein Ciccas_007367 [Cichlidogyrus casuarinus]|uniref:Uncharacterized protein n=1 Tax=Cichlidogyrus casuarinus TaxID=1844966 RepID=A0ABD2Q342_9PLAT